MDLYYSCGHGILRWRVALPAVYCRLDLVWLGMQTQHPKATGGQRWEGNRFPSSF